MNEKTMKSKNMLDSFTAYCLENPDQRFWQALRNWSRYAFVFGAPKEWDGNPRELEDTFFKE